MQAEERDAAYLWDMREAARGVVEFTRRVTLDEFLAWGRRQQMLRLAVERELEIVGEAARRVSATYRTRHPEMPWKELVGLRNVISHQYDKVNYEEIYRIARGRLPELLVTLDKLVPRPPDASEQP